MTYPSDARDYSKEAQRGRMSNLAAVRAFELAKQGWLISRESWRGQSNYVVWAKHGTYTAQDGQVGILSPFYVMRIGRDTHVVWMPTPVDLAAEDWLAVSRQEIDQQSAAKQSQIEDQSSN